MGIFIHFEEVRGSHRREPFSLLRPSDNSELRFSARFSTKEKHFLVTQRIVLRSPQQFCYLCCIATVSTVAQWFKWFKAISKSLSLLLTHACLEFCVLSRRLRYLFTLQMKLSSTQHSTSSRHEINLKIQLRCHLIVLNVSIRNRWWCLSDFLHSQSLHWLVFGVISTA